MSQILFITFTDKITLKIWGKSSFYKALKELYLNIEFTAFTL